MSELVSDSGVVQVDDTEEDRGRWMATSLGGRFYPANPRPEEIFISDIANGGALDCRYDGQGRVDKYYSVNEHQVLGSQWCITKSQPFLQHSVMRQYWLNMALAFLVHDGAEGYINDLNRATKAAVGKAYTDMEKTIQDMIFDKLGLLEFSKANAKLLKEIDCRLVPLEKEAIFRYPQIWSFDEFEPLDDTVIQCWPPVTAKKIWLEMYHRLCIELDKPVERYEI